MPIVRIDIQAGKSTAYKRALLHGVRSAITNALDVADERVQQRIIETPAENIDAPEIRSDALAVIEIAMLPGRGPDLKSRLYEAICANLGADPGIHAHDIMVLVNAPSAECFAIGGVMQCTLAAQPGDPGAVGADEDDS